jgi:hypothetical protein
MDNLRPVLFCAAMVLMTSFSLVLFEQQHVWGWELRVELSDSTFGSDQVCASVEGGYGYGPVNRCTNPGRDAAVVFNLGDRIEEDENYHVCAWGGLLSALFSNCEYFLHGSGDETVRMSVGR